MIIVELTGGLGNQMFQYAFGKALSIKNNTILKLDISFFENYEWHSYSLAPFNIEENFVTAAEKKKIKDRDNLLLNRLTRKILGLSTIYHTEKSLHYDAQHNRISDPAYLRGYWQSEKYFADYVDIIKKQFSVKPAPSVQNQLLLNKISETQSVSLHIRRGNYVNVPAVNATHGVCSLEYYHGAIDHISNQCDNPMFYIFSDDIPWAKENLKLSHKHEFVDINNDETDFEDMRLMYNCKHHILANSTFSWWGAWLNSNAQKVVIAPQKWFNDAELNECSKSIIPESWITL